MGVHNRRSARALSSTWAFGPWRCPSSAASGLLGDIYICFHLAVPSRADWLLNRGPMGGPRRVVANLSGDRSQVCKRLESGRHSNLSRPILLRLPLHRSCRRILELEPVRGPSGSVVGPEALGHDAFEAHLAGVPEDHVAPIIQVLVDP